MELRKLLETLDDNQYVDICFGVDRNNVPKTVYCGRAKVLLESKTVLSGFENYSVRQIAAYMADIDGDQWVFVQIILEN